MSKPNLITKESIDLLNQLVFVYFHKHFQKWELRSCSKPKSCLKLLQQKFEFEDRLDDVFTHCLIASEPSGSGSIQSQCCSAGCAGRRQEAVSEKGLKGRKGPQQRRGATQTLAEGGDMKSGGLGRREAACQPSHAVAQKEKPPVKMRQSVKLTSSAVCVSCQCCKYALNE